MNTIRDLVASIKEAVREWKRLRRRRHYRASLKDYDPFSN